MNFTVDLTKTLKPGGLYDAIIIGGGPAGLTAGLYLVRYRWRVLMLEKQPQSGGQLAVTEWVENYPGFPEPVLGQKLAKDMEDQARFFGLQILRENVTSVSLDSPVKSVQTGYGSYDAKTVLIATGASPRKLGLPEEDKYIGRGISYCATCDGPFYPDKKLVVVGGGNSAFQESLFLIRYAREIIIVHRGTQITADEVLQEKVAAYPNISICLNTIVKKIDFQDEKDRKIIVQNTNTDTEEIIQTDGLFIFIGYKPNTGLFTDKIVMENGYIVTDEHHETNVPAVYAAGDVETKEVRQVATAVGDGAEAAHWMNIYLENQKEKNARIA
jgi:thioredoxin reductase (NADPH)